MRYLEESRDLNRALAELSKWRLREWEVSKLTWGLFGRGGKMRLWLL